jgi:hypothetical protein
MKHKARAEKRLNKYSWKPELEILFGRSECIEGKLIVKFSFENDNESQISKQEEEFSE